MPTIDCKRENCPETIEVEPDDETARCQKCGVSRDVPDIFPEPPVADGPVPDVSRVVAELDTEGKDVHLHVHYHTD